jgi:hypothetical protein
MKENESPSSYTLVSLDELKEKIRNSKNVKVIVTDSQATGILQKSSYKIENKAISNEDGSQIIGVDGLTPSINFGAIMPGSNVFIPRNRSAFYKYLIENKKKLLKWQPQE